MSSRLIQDNFPSPLLTLISADIIYIGLDVFSVILMWIIKNIGLDVLSLILSWVIKNIGLDIFSLIMNNGTSSVEIESEIGAQYRPWVILSELGH